METAGKVMVGLGVGCLGFILIGVFGLLTTLTSRLAWGGLSRL